MEKKVQDYLLQLATGSKSITANRFSHFDYSDVISSDSFGYGINNNGEIMNAHFQLRILNVDKVISTLELEYVPLKVGEQYYELGELREPRTIYNLPIVLAQLNNAGYTWCYQERFWS